MKKIQEIAHYKKHPQMIPFIGEYWGKTGKLLVVGESHYLNDNDEKSSKIENKKIWKNWYNITSKELTPDQLRWTSTAPMIDEAIRDDYYYPGWGVWRYTKDAILETGFNPDKSNTSKILCFIAYMNFFQRPALKSGESIVFNNEDINIANETLNNVVDIVKAEYLFFVSSTAWKNFDKGLLKDKIIGHSCHPTCRWWNMESKTYTKPKTKEKITGKESFKYFIKTNKIFDIK